MYDIFTYKIIKHMMYDLTYVFCNMQYYIQVFKLRPERSSSKGCGMHVPMIPAMLPATLAKRWQKQKLLLVRGGSEKHAGKQDED